MFSGAGGTIERDHGYNFEVPATGSSRTSPSLPLKAMGRFNHEAVAVDPRTSVMYIAPVAEKGCLKFLYVAPAQLHGSDGDERVDGFVDGNDDGSGLPGYRRAKRPAQREDAQPQHRGR